MTTSEIVEDLREEISCGLPPSKQDIVAALSLASTFAKTDEWADVEILARLAADLAGMLQRQKPDNGLIIHGKWAKEGLEGPK